MSHDEFVAWLTDEVANQRMTIEQMQDLLTQKGYLDEIRGGFDREFAREIVGYVAEQFLRAPDVQSILQAAAARFPSRMLYFEPIGVDLF